MIRLRSSSRCSRNDILPSSNPPSSSSSTGGRDCRELDCLPGKGTRAIAAFGARLLGLSGRDSFFDWWCCRSRAQLSGFDTGSLLFAGSLLLSAALFHPDLLF